MGNGQKSQADRRVPTHLFGTRQALFYILNRGKAQTEVLRRSEQPHKMDKAPRAIETPASPRADLQNIQHFDDFIFAD